jgi:AraC-like DNA-binding protein
LEANRKARILTGQQCCSVLVAATAIARTCIDHRSSSDDNKVPTTPPRAPSGPSDAWDFLTALRAIIRPYLAQGHPPLSLVAEIIGMSERSLQRRLAQSGSTYSQIVQDARFSIASELLTDSDLNIADIAFAAGYDNAPHFSRAFKLALVQIQGQRLLTGDMALSRLAELIHGDHGMRRLETGLRQRRAVWLCR